MVGYFCIGKDARVPGWDYDESALDFGMGLRPDVIGQGNARLYLNAILEFLDHQWPGKGIRATVASWNQRAVRACSHFGFRQISAFVGVTGQRLDYVVLLRD